MSIFRLGITRTLAIQLDHLEALLAGMNPETSPTITQIINPVVIHAHGITKVPPKNLASMLPMAIPKSSCNSS